MRSTSENWLEAWGKQLETVRDGFSTAARSRALRLSGSKATLLSEATRAFAVSAVVMGGCFIGLIAAPEISARIVYGRLVAGAAIAGGIACLTWYGRIVGTALR